MGNPRNFLTEKDVLSGIPERWHHFITLKVPNNLSQKTLPLIKSLWKAFELIDITVNLEFITSFSIAIGINPYRIKDENLLNMEVTLNDGVIAAYSGRLIFIDLKRILARPDYEWTAIYLEELIHVVMHIHDEVIVKKIVALFDNEVLAQGDGYISSSLR